MTAPPDRSTSARRPLLQRKHAKRALVNVGGAVETAGEESVARGLAAALTIRPGERDATLTHPFHAYPARLHPEVTRALLGVAKVERGGVVLDPFCGSGTVLIEAMAAGNTAMGRDLSPFAVELASLKTRLTSARERGLMVDITSRVTRLAKTRVREQRRAPVPRGEERWFAPYTLAEVAALAEEIRQLEAGFVRDALRMLLSSIVVKVSLQASDSDTRPVRKSVAPGAALRFFEHKSHELARCLAALAGAVARGTARADVRVDDAASLATVPEGVARAIVTSPPYANTYDYVDQHARRYAWLGLDTSGMRAGEIGAARWFEVPEAGVVRFRRELGAMCRSFARALAPGGIALVVMADGAAGGEPVRADRLLREAAEAEGLKFAARASQERKTFDTDSTRAFARQPKREHVIALTRT